MRTTIIRTGLIAIVAGALFLGCSDDETVNPNPKLSRFKKQTSPENVLHNLGAAYEAREIAPYDSLIYDAGGAAADTFSYFFSDGDIVRCGTPPSWGRAQEICATRRLFEADRVTSLQLKLTPGSSSRRDDRRVIHVSDVYMTMVARPDSTGGATTYLVRGLRAEFEFKVQWVDARGDSLWRIVSWKDLPPAYGSEIPPPSGWGCWKYFYSAGCD